MAERTHDVSARIGNLAEVARKISEATGQIAASSESLSQMPEELRGAVAAFKL
ncbi:MAG: hypothetical protein ACM3RP_00455 [Chitinophagales bacterium]